MSVLPLPTPDRRVVRCANRHCNKVLTDAQSIALRYGPDCAEARGLVSPSGRVPWGRQAGPDLFDQLNEGETMTDESFALRVLDVIGRADLHGELFWRTDGEYAPVSFFINCSDTFAWGGSDCEPLTADNLAEFERALRDATAASGSNMHGPELFCARQRKMRPQGAAYPSDEKLWPLFDACGPEREVGLLNPRRPGERKAAAR